VTAPSPENLRTLFEFVFKGLDALGYQVRAGRWVGGRRAARGCMGLQEGGLTCCMKREQPLNPNPNPKHSLIINNHRSTSIMTWWSRPTRRLGARWCG